MSKPNKGPAPKPTNDPAQTTSTTEATQEPTVDNLDPTADDVLKTITDSSPETKATETSPEPVTTTEAAQAPTVTDHGLTKNGERVVTFNQTAKKQAGAVTIEAAVANLDPAHIRAQANATQDIRIMTIEQDLDHLTTRFHPSTQVPAAESAKDMVAFYRLMKNVLETDKTQDEFARQWMLIADRFKDPKHNKSFNGRNLFRGVQSWNLDHEEYNCYMVLVNCFEMMKMYPDRKFFSQWDPGSRHLNPITEVGRGRLLQFLQMNMVG